MTCIVWCLRLTLVNYNFPYKKGKTMFSDILLCVDFDRTLTATDGTIPPRNLEAIRYFMERGGAFTVNTGRSTASMGDLVYTVPVNAPFLLYNGSAAWEQGRLTQVYPIALDLWHTMEDLHARFPGVNLEIQAADKHYLLWPTEQYAAYYQTLGWDHAVAEPGSDLGPFLKFACIGPVEGAGTPAMFAPDRGDLEELDRAEDYLRETYGETVEVFRSGTRIVDVHAKGVSKLRAVRTLQERLGKKILVCVGDAKNDIAMLSGADYAYCPADSELAGMYETVCPCGEGAVADVVYSKIPGFFENKP